MAQDRAFTSRIIPRSGLTIPMPSGITPPKPSIIADLMSLTRITDHDGSEWVRADLLDEVIKRHA